MCQVALSLQDERVGGRAQGILFLLSVERLLRKLTAFECGLHARTILSDGELCVANFDSYLILQLLQQHLGLSVLQFRPHLVGLGGTVADGNIYVETNCVIGKVITKQRGKGVAETPTRDGAGRDTARGV